MYDLGSVVSQLYNGHTLVKLLQQCTELLQFKTLRCIKLKTGKTHLFCYIELANSDQHRPFIMAPKLVKM